MNALFALALALAPADEPVRAGLEVDATALGESGDVLGERLTTRGEAVLREAEVLKAQDAGDPVVHLVVEPLPDNAGFRCTYELRRDGEAVGGTQGSSECRLCTDDELEAQVSAAIGRLVPRIGDSAPDTDDPAPVPTPTAGQPEPQGWLIGPMGKAGIGLSVGGAAVLGVGLGLAISEPILLNRGGARSRVLSVAGITTAAIGAAILVSGVVLLAVDQTRSRRRKVAATPTGLRIVF